MYTEEIKLNILKNEVCLDDKCWACKGTGKGKPSEAYPAFDENGVCEACNGTGYRLTDKGRAIMDLVRRHGKGYK